MKIIIFPLPFLLPCAGDFDGEEIHLSNNSNNKGEDGSGQFRNNNGSNGMRYVVISCVAVSCFDVLLVITPI